MGSGVTVTAAPATTPVAMTELPFTGISTGLLAVIALGLAMAGTCLLKLNPSPGQADQQLHGSCRGCRRQFSAKKQISTLAHGGMLFLDELGEFPPHLLNALSQPIEEVTRSERRGRRVAFPARAKALSAPLIHRLSSRKLAGTRNDPHVPRAKKWPVITEDFATTRYALRPLVTDLPWLGVKRTPVQIWPARLSFRRGRHLSGIYFVSSLNSETAPAGSKEALTPKEVRAEAKLEPLGIRAYGCERKFNGDG
ncbi:MAG: ATP-binding protein [Actinobacteria bacterium]|nr:ATP-binding protein [Actinomycetota bacterium]